MTPLARRADAPHITCMHTLIAILFSLTLDGGGGMDPNGGGTNAGVRIDDNG